MNHLNPKIVIILLWIVVMFNMLFADVFSLIVELDSGGVMDIPINVKVAMGIAAILTNIPILMIALTWILPSKVNKWANIGAAIFTILYVIGGGVLLPHYIIIGTIEVTLMICIIILNFKSYQKEVCIRSLTSIS